MGEGSDAILRGPENASQGKESVAKLNQVIQVCSEDCFAKGKFMLISGLIIELFHQSCFDNTPFQDCVTSRIC